MKKQSFLAGAAILMAANAVSKILGAVLKIPLAYILKEDGMAVYSIAFDAYIMFLAFIISGLPFAVSKLSAEAHSRGDIGRERKLVSVSTWLLVLIGLAGTAVLYFGAPFFALAMKEEKAVLAIRIISPSVFFVALGTGYKSYFQGVSQMIPVALSQVAEAFVKLAAGYALALMFVKYGSQATAAGAISGVTAGEIVATAILAAAYIFRRRAGDRSIKRSAASTRVILKDIASLALPLLCASVASNAINIADTTMIRTRLIDAGLGADRARFLYGAYTGYALTIFHLPIGILATLGVSILPVIAGAYAAGNEKKARSAADAGIRISIILSVPCAVMMYTMSGEMLTLLFRNDTSALMLKTIAPCAVAMCLAQMTAAVLQSAGEIGAPLRNALIGGGIKLALGYFLIGDPNINIYGSALSANVSFFLTAVLNLISIRKNLGLKLKMMEMLIKPLICGAAMYGALTLVIPHTRQFGNTICLISSAVIACAVYALTAVLSGTIPKIKFLQKQPISDTIAKNKRKDNSNGNQTALHNR